MSYFAFLAAVAALQFKVSVSSKIHTSYIVVIMFMFVAISNVTDDLDDVFSCNSSSVSGNDCLSVSQSVCLSVDRYFLHKLKLKKEWIKSKT